MKPQPEYIKSPLRRSQVCKIRHTQEERERERERARARYGRKTDRSPPHPPITPVSTLAHKSPYNGPTNMLHACELKENTFSVGFLEN